MAEFLDLDGLGYFKSKQDAQNGTTYATKQSLPTKVSQLQNDKGYQTASDVNSIVNSKVTNVYTYRGTVAKVGDLPETGNSVGDVYDVGGGMNYAWDGAKWDALGDAKLTVDTALSATSANPVQNKAVKAALDLKQDKSYVHPTATGSNAGYMSAADKSKLDGISAGANKYVLPTASGSVLGGIKVGANLTIANGVLSGTPDTKYSSISNASIDALFA